MSHVFGMKTANHQFHYNILSYWNEISEFTKGKSFYLHLIFFRHNNIRKCAQTLNKNNI